MTKIMRHEIAIYWSKLRHLWNIIKLEAKNEMNNFRGIPINLLITSIVTWRVGIHITVSKSILFNQLKYAWMGIYSWYNIRIGREVESSNLCRKIKETNISYRKNWLLHVEFVNLKFVYTYMYNEYTRSYFRLKENYITAKRV